MVEQEATKGAAAQPAVEVAARQAVVTVRLRVSALGRLLAPRPGTAGAAVSYYLIVPDLVEVTYEIAVSYDVDGPAPSWAWQAQVVGEVVTADGERTGLRDSVHYRQHSGQITAPSWLAELVMERQPRGGGLPW